MTAEQYAPAVLQAGRDLGITPKGIVIAFATVYVESNWTMYANAKVPDSMSIPHEAVGSDGYSVGLFQQQVVDSGNGWWWGDAATCMDPYKSATLFFQRLKRLDYNSDAQSPGSYAQAIQQSAFPDRYDQHMADAQSLYDQISGGTVTIPTEDPRLAALAAVRPDFNEYANWSDNSQDRAGTTVDLWLIHTEEGDMNADALVTWMKDNGVSYHYAGSQDPNDGGVTVVDMIDTDLASWSVMNSNGRSINFCYAGSYSSWTRDEWMSKAGKVIDVAAYLAVQDAIKYPKLAPARVIVPYADPPGIADHRYCSVYLQDGNNHSDVGGPLQPPWTGFPWDYFTDRVAFYWAAANNTTDDAVQPTPPPPAVPKIPTGDAAVRLLMEQQLGPWDDAAGRFTGWPQLAGDPDALKVLQGKVDAGIPLSQVDAIAATRFNVTPSKLPKSVCAPAPKKPPRKAAKKAPAKASARKSAR